jgi:hypothetical protein
MEEDIPVWVLRPSTVEALATQLNPRKILLSESGTGRGWGDARREVAVVWRNPMVLLFRNSAGLAGNPGIVQPAKVAGLAVFICVLKI